MLDPDNAYKKVKAKNFKPPKYFEIGTVVPGPTEYYSGPSKKERNRTLVDEVLKNAEMKQHIKEKFAKLVASKSGLGKRKLLRSTNNKDKKRTKKPKSK